MTRLMPRLAGAFATLLLASNVAHAQMGTGFPPFGSFSSGAPDTINYGNLNVHLQIPIVSKAGRGLPFSYTLTYDSSVWSKYNALGDLAWTPSASWGWGGITTANTGYVTYSTSPQSCTYGSQHQQYNWTVYIFESYLDPNGTAHAINTDVSTWNSGPCGSGPSYSATVPATDGSGYTFAITASPSATIYSPSGQVISPLQTYIGAGTITDSNGNFLSATSSSGTTTYTDTLGDTALTVSSTQLTYTNPSGGSSSFIVNY